MLQNNSKMIKTSADSHRRYVFLNLLRVIACAVVIGYHFFKEAFLLNLTSFPDPDDVLPIGNIHPVMIAVSIFFIISGKGLALKMGHEDKPDWKKFYLGRFKAILVPFYITWILWAVYKLITAGLEAFAGIGAKSILCTLFGADTFAQLYTPVFTLHVGEWFLGALVVLYVFFPVFYTLLKKYFVPALAMAAIAYVVVVMTYSSAIPWHMNIITRMFCFVFGIAIGMLPELFGSTIKGSVKRYFALFENQRYNKIIPSNIMSLTQSHDPVCKSIVNVMMKSTHEIISTTYFVSFFRFQIIQNTIA